nr:reverse transcriptase domain-containing protein [Tanacetum cinerariifolium]
MADQRTMAELLRAPTEGYIEAIVVLSIPGEQFELKHSLINMMTSDQFLGLEKDNPHDHIRWGSPSVARKRTLADLIHACPHHGFTELHQLDTFYNALNTANQDSLNAATGGNMLERRTQDVLMIIKNKSKVRNSRNKSVVSQVKSCDADCNSSSEIAKLTHAFNQQTSAVTTAMTSILKKFQATLPPAFVKAVEEIYVTCGGAHPYYMCLTAGSGSLPSNTVANLKGELKVITTRSCLVFDRPTVPTPPLFTNPEVDEHVEETLTDQDLSESGSRPSNTIANPKGELKAITTQSRIVLDGPQIPIPPPFINPEEDERVKETLTDQDLSEYTIKVPPPLKMLKSLLSNKEKLQELANIPLNENCSAVILKKLPEKLGDPRNFSFRVVSMSSSVKP